MKPSLLYLLFLALMFCCCRRNSKTSIEGNVNTIIIDSSLRATINCNIEFISDKYFSEFKTPIEARFFSNGSVSDSIIQNAFSMGSWYSSHRDTIELVAHIGEFETEALLIRFIEGKPAVLFFRAPHDVEGSKYFKVNKTDTFSHQIEVTPVRYKLKLSEIPDTAKKQVVFGHIDLESEGYYDKRDSVDQRRKVQMKFYFRSQHRKFHD